MLIKSPLESFELASMILEQNPLFVGLASIVLMACSEVFEPSVTVIRSEPYIFRVGFDDAEDVLRDASTRQEGYVADHSLEEFS